jgi:hypothetical protein
MKDYVQKDIADFILERNQWDKPSEPNPRLATSAKEETSDLLTGMFASLAATEESVVDLYSDVFDSQATLENTMKKLLGRP